MSQSFSTSMPRLNLPGSPGGRRRAVEAEPTPTAANIKVPAPESAPPARAKSTPAPPKQEKPKEQDTYNPVLDEDDEEVVTPTPSSSAEEEVVVSPGETKSKAGGEPKEKATREPRARLYEDDYLLIEFLYEYEFATVSQLRALFEGRALPKAGTRATDAPRTGKPVSQRHMLQRLRRLEAGEFIEQLRVPRGHSLWFCTSFGQQAIGRSAGREPKRAKTVAWSRVEHTLMRNQVAAALMGFESYGAPTLDLLKAGKPSGADIEFVSESFMERAFNKEHKGIYSTLDKAEAQVARRDEFLNSLREQTSVEGLAFTEAQYPEIWTAAFVEQAADSSYRQCATARPDLVFHLPRRTPEKGNSIAIELERENKDVDYYVNRFKAYSNWKAVYHRVYYVLVDRDPNRRKTRSHAGLDQRTKLQYAIKVADCEGFIRLVSLRDTDGKPFYDNKTLWEL